MSTRIEFELGTRPKARNRRADDAAMLILILGDFSGRANRGLLEHGAELAERPVRSVDVDNFDDVMFHIAPRLHLPSGDPSGAGMVLEFQQLDDFHPDSLYDRHELFRALKENRERLRDPATYPEAAAQLKRWATEGPAPEESEAPPDSVGDGPPVEDDAATLERLLGKPATGRTEAGPRPAMRPDFDRIIRAIVEPHIAPGRDPQQPQLVSAIDAGIAERMLGILHARAFRELESAWRSLHDLVCSAETGERVKLFLLDVSKDELAADLPPSGGDSSPSGLYSSLVDQRARTLGGEPWSVIVGNYRFGPSAGEAALLEGLGALASQAGGPFLAGGDPQLLGCSSAAELPDPALWEPTGGVDGPHWRALRKSHSASWIGLTLPRLLLRLPYGAKTEEVERFEFEELRPTSPIGDHEKLLWGNSAFACAELLGRSFEARGWAMQPGDHLEIEDLPAHIYEEAGAARMTPCAEVYLSERTADAVLERGLMPMLSFRDRNVARLARFQSLADPPASLSGPWS